MKNVFSAVVAVFCLIIVLPMNAQEMKRTSWTSFGVSFQIPTDMEVEDDSEEGYVLSNEKYYVNVQILDGEAMNKDAMAKEVKQIADDDQLGEQTPVKQFELAQFHGAQLQGTTEGEFYLYNYLMSKDESGGFFVTVIFKDKADLLPYTIIKSFQLED